jgi:hypothetical protein
MEQIDNLIKGKGLHIALIMLTFFVIYRMFVIGSIHSQRELPIEVDDAYVYISQAHMFYDNYDRTKETTSSIQSIAQLTFENDTSDSIQNVSRYYVWVADQLYFFYSATFGFFTEILDIDPVKVSWAFAYVTQFLIALSVILIAGLYLGGTSLQFVVAVILSAFVSVEFTHQIKATPFTIANAILLIGWWAINVNRLKNRVRWLFGGLLIALSLHIHPGAFVVLGLLSATALIIWVWKNNTEQKSVFFYTVFIVLATALIENFVFYIMNGERYLSLINTETLASTRHQMSVLEFITFNFRETFSRLMNFSNFLSVRSGYLSLYLYLFALLSLFFLNKKLLIVNIVFLLGTVAGLLHYVPGHKGELIEYVGQTQIIVMAMAFSVFYVYIFNTLKRHKKYYLHYGFITILALSFLVKNLSSTGSQIDKRAKRHNFPNQVEEIKEFSNNLPQGTSLIVGDEFVYIMLLSEVDDRSIVLADHMRKNGIWSVPKNIPRPSGYIGKPVNKVFVGGIPYNINNNNNNNNRIIFSSVD